MKRNEADKIVLELQTMQKRAHAAGLHFTARALNNTMNACGWEIAGNLDQAVKAVCRDMAVND